MCGMGGARHPTRGWGGKGGNIQLYFEVCLCLCLVSDSEGARCKANPTWQSSLCTWRKHNSVAKRMAVRLHHQLRAFESVPRNIPGKRKPRFIDV